MVLARLHEQAGPTSVDEKSDSRDEQIALDDRRLESRAMKVECLHDFVEQRGLEMDNATRKSRRLRTCILTSDDSSHLAYANQILVHI